MMLFEMIFEEENLGRDIVGTILFLILAFGSFFLKFLAPFVILLLTIFWYILIGHRLIGRWLDVVFNMARGNYSPAPAMEKKIASLVEKEKFEEAIQKCREWMKYEKENSRPILLLCEILVNHQSSTTQAIQELELSVMRPFPAEDHVNLALNLAQLYQRTGKEEKIKDLFHRIRSLHPKSPAVQALKS